MRLDNINKEIIRLSIPTIVSNVTIPLLGICDTAISGHLGSELFLSAIAVGSVMQNVVFWIFGFLRGGTTGLTANALGAGYENEISKVIYRALVIAAVAGFLLILFRQHAFRFLWWLTGGSDEIKGYVFSYFNLRIWGAPALLAVIAISGWFVGMQNTFFPMLIAILMNVINIGMSCLLVYVYDYGFDGIAFGTMISNWIGLLVAIFCIIIFRKGKPLRCRLSNLLKGEWWRYFSVNGNLFLRSLFIICVTIGVTAAGARFGNLTLAINVIVMQFFQFFSFFMDGFAFSGEAMIGLRVGEKNWNLMSKSVNRLLQWTLAVGLIFSIIYLLATPMIASLLTDNTEVIEGVSLLTPWIASIPILSCWAFIYDGFYVGITDTFKMMISTLLGSVLFFFIISLDSQFSDIDGINLIWTAFISYLTARGIYLASMWKITVKKVIDKTTNKVYLQ